MNERTSRAQRGAGNESSRRERVPRDRDHDHRQSRGIGDDPRRGHHGTATTETATTAIPVMDESVAPMLPDGRFTGIGVKGLHFPRRWTMPGVHPYDEIEWETRTAAIGNEKGVNVFEQKDVEVPAFWSQLATNVVVSKYFRGHLGTPERETTVRQLIDRVVNTIAAWAETAALLRHGRRPARLPGRADPPPRPPEDELQLAGLVQRRRRSAPPVLRLLHQLGPGLDELDHGPGQDRGDAVQVRFGRRLQPLHAPVEQGEDVGRRHRLGPGQLHARLRRLRRRGQVGRQDPPRRQDGDPRRHPSGHPGVHQLQAQGREEGLGPDRGRLRRRASPARHTARSPSRTPTIRSASPTTTCAPWSRTATGPPEPSWTAADGDVQGPRPLPRDGRGGLGLRRPRHPVRHHHQRLEPRLQLGPPARN